MFREIEVTPEEEEEMIRKIAEKVHNYGMDVAAVLFLESVKPLAYIGGQMGRVFVSPFLPAFGESISTGGEKFLTIFEKRDNVEKLLNRIEELTKEEEDSKKRKKAGKEAPKAENAGQESEKVPKKGWRRFLPF